MQALLDVTALEQVLALFEIEIQVLRDEVAELVRLFGVQRGDFNLVGGGRRKLENLLKLPMRIPRQRRHLDIGRISFGNNLNLGFQIRRECLVFLDANAAQALDQHAHGVVRELEHLEHAPGATVFPKVFRQRIVDIGFALQDES